MVRRDDEKAYQVLVERGIQVVEHEPYRAEWEAAAAKTRERLVGRIFSRSLLEEAQAAARGQ